MKILELDKSKLSSCPIFLSSRNVSHQPKPRRVKGSNIPWANMKPGSKPLQLIHYVCMPSIKYRRSNLTD